MLTLVSLEEVCSPQVEYNPSLASQACSQPTQHCCVRGRIKMTKALTQDHDRVILAELREIVAQIHLDVTWSAAELARLSEDACIPVDASNQVASVRECSSMAAHPAAYIGDAIKIGQRGERADEVCFCLRPSV